MITEQYNHRTMKQAVFSGLVMTPGEQYLIRGQLPRTHGITYLMARRQMQELGDIMGLDYLTQHPEKTYQQCVKDTEGLE